KSSPSGTRAGRLMIRPTTKFSTATTEDGKINTTDSLKRGSPKSGRATRKRALSSAAALGGLSCVVCAGAVARASKRQEIKAAALDLRIDIAASHGKGLKSTGADKSIAHACGRPGNCAASAGQRRRVRTAVDLRIRGGVSQSGWLWRGGVSRSGWLWRGQGVRTTGKGEGGTSGGDVTPLSCGGNEKPKEV